MAGSHVVVGLAAWAWAAPHLGLPPLSPAALALAAAGALLPDIDHPASWVGRRLWMLSRPLSRLVGHRGFTHSALAVILGAVLLHRNGANRLMLDALVVGYLSHLAADLLTSSGLRLAWPAPGRYALALCRTGSALEPVIVTAFAAWIGSGLLQR